MNDSKPSRLYIFTGKGGVGKTTLSKSFVKYLSEHDHEVAYVTFKNQSISENHSSTNEDVVSGIREIHLDLEDCAKGYIEKKLNSKMIASWVVKTPFFRALINMVPGFNYLIYLGKILEMGHENPRLILVLDAPASGHALTMIESTSNFQQIFESGIIFEDTSKMLSRLNDPEYTKIHIISLPSTMSWQEAIELKTGIQVRTPVVTDITINNCLYPLLKNHLTELPPALKEKTENEEALIKEHEKEILAVLPHSLVKIQKNIELDLVNSMKHLL
jgi:anion-transporting  ArsA/GET3 family ATPase